MEDESQHPQSPQANDSHEQDVRDDRESDDRGHESQDDSELGIQTASASSIETSDDHGGLWRIRVDGQARMDATCGRVSSLGLGDAHLAAVFQGAGAEYLGDANRRDVGEQDPDLARLLWNQFSDLNESHAIHPINLGSIGILPSADQAIEFAVRSARCRGAVNRFRVVTLIGSDHGRTTLCRTLSGRPELHEDFGPMVPGVLHCPVGDLNALRSILDESVAAVVLSPMDSSNACRRLDASYLGDVAELCKQQDIELIMDETPWSFASTGRPYTYQQIAKVPCDTVVLSAGLFGGVGGGVILTRFRLAECDVRGNSSIVGAADPLGTGNLTSEDAGDSVNPAPQDVSSMVSHPQGQADVSVWLDPGTILQGRLVAATLQRLDSLDLWDAGRADGLAEDLAEAIGGFEFVREFHVTGTIIGIETDLPAIEIVRSAERQGLIVESAGETSIGLQLPISVIRGRNREGSDWQECVRKLRTALEAIERKTVEI